MIQYINVPENDFGRGIDARSTENQIGEGFVRDLLNADVIQRSVRKRTGYESYAGNIPVRVTRLDYIDSKNQMCFTLDSVVSLNTSISLESVRSSPIVVYGRKSTNTNTGVGPITTTDSVHYYSKFLVPIRKELIAPSGILNIAGTEHGLGTTQFFCNIVESTSLLNKSYEDVDVNAIRIDSATYDVNIDYNTVSTIDTIVYYKNETFVPGDNWIEDISHDGIEVTQTFNIPTTTHNLLNYNIIYQLYQDTGSEWIQVKPNQFLIQPNGNIDIQITNDTGSSINYKLILSASPTINSKPGIIVANSTGTVTISGVESPWIFYNIYLEQTPGGTKEQVEANSVIYNDETQDITLQFDNQFNQPRNFIIYYQYGDIRSNVLCVEDVAVTANGTDYAPQITLWGLDHSEIYSTKSAREGWTTHIDTYRRSGEQRVIAGLGGNLFSAQTYSEAAAQYKYARLWPSLQSRASAALNVGPLFYDTGDDPKRSRGYITTDMGGTGQVSVTAVEYENTLSGFVGTTKYTLTVPNMQILNSAGNPTTIDSVVSTTTGLEDWLTVNNMSYKRHDGTFRIRKIISGSNELQVWVENAQNNSSDWDDEHTGGYAGVFTDHITWLSICGYIPGDTLIFAGNDLAEVYLSDDDKTVCGPFSSIVEIPAGVLITGRRTSELVPMRQSLPSLADSVENLVRGDMLFYTGIDRHLRVLSINADSDRTISISGNGTSATVTLTSGDTTFLSNGQKVLLIGAGNYTGVQAVSNILSPTQFTFNTTYSDSVSSAILSGKTVEIDEQLEWADTSGDSNLFQVARRWIPIEAPDDNFNLTPTTYVRHFDSAEYSAQPFIRSTMVADNLYLTNGSDEVMKFDGQNIYRAGLPAWQPGLFVTLDTSSAAKIVIPKPRSMTSVASTTNIAAYRNRGELPVSAEDTGTIPVGTQVFLNTATGTFSSPYTIRGYQDKGSGGGTHVVQFDRALDSSIVHDTPISEIVGSYKYYFRLNAIDANDNIIASAMTSSDDMTVRMAQNAAIRLKLVGMPVLDNYDYDRIEVEIYRTRLLLSGVAPVFYKVVTLGNLTVPSVSFNKTAGYLEYIDTNSDSDIASDTNLDILSTQSGSELGIGWSDPLRAKYITTTNNRLVLGNVRDYPEFDIQIESSTDLTPTTFNNHSILFRKDFSDTGPISNMVDRVKFQWTTTASSIAVTGLSGTLNTSFTVTVANSAAIGDWVYLYYSAVLTTGQPLKYAGWWQIASCDANSITINCTTAEAGTPAVRPDRAVFGTAGTVPVFLGTDGNLGQTNGDFLGSASDKFDATRRLALAINSVMRMTDTNLVPNFRPWLIARSGNDVSRAGQILVRAPYQSDVLPSVEASFDTYALYVNSLPAISNPLTRSCTYTIDSTTVTTASTSGLIVGTRIYDGLRIPLNTVITEITNGTTFKISKQALSSGASTTQFSIPVEASERIYPSRILVSYQNYPELFDTPTAILDSDSLSAIDINPADGQEITGVIPFFGEAAFTAAQQAGILVVFKTNSIYLVDINQKVSGSNLVVQRLETQGLGCTAPYSISVTKNGIMFANNSGIYRLRRDQAIEYIGKFMERNWVNRVDRDVLSLAQGHHYGVGRMYKLSVPISGTEDTATGYIEPSEVYVYNHTQEEEGQLGAWSRYDNHTAIGWANLASDAFWASTGGKIYILRATNSETDFRDSNEPIVFRLDTRPNDYGNSGIRKVLDKVVASYRTGANTASNNMYFAVDLEQEYSATTPFRVAGTAENLTGFDDQVQKDIITLRHSLDRRKGVYFSIRIENSNLDENVEIAGLDYRIGGLDSKGIKSASKT